MKKLILGLALILGACGLATQPAAALDFLCPEGMSWAECVSRYPSDCYDIDCIKEAEIIQSSAIDPTFVVETDSDGFANLKFGNNLLLAGNNFTNSAKTSGLLFSFGNNLNQKSDSEYLFAAGNNITFTGKVSKDLFIAGNNVQFKSVAKIGGDIYAAGNTILLEVDLSGDFSATAAKVIINGVAIHGNVNLTADTIIFEEGTSIDGTLVYNDDANISGLDKIKVGNIQTYTPETHNIGPAVFWIGRLLSACGLFVTLLLLVLAFPRTKERIITATSSAHLGNIIISGLGVMILLPIVAVLLMMTYVATVTGIILLVVYIVLLYVAQAFAGAYFGHIIISKLFRNGKCPLLLEALVGIVLIVGLEAIPMIAGLVGLIATVVGLGTMVTIIRPRKTVEAYTGNAKSAPQVIAPKAVDNSEKPANSKTTKAAKSTPKSKKSTTKKK